MNDAHLDDGTYDAFVVWAEPRDDAGVALELTITTGTHKGGVVTVVATRALKREPLMLVGLPCALIVENGSPRVAFD